MTRITSCEVRVYSCQLDPFGPLSKTRVFPLSEEIVKSGELLLFIIHRLAGVLFVGDKRKLEVYIDRILFIKWIIKKIQVCIKSIINFCVICFGL